MLLVGSVLASFQTLILANLIFFGKEVSANVSYTSQTEVPRANGKSCKCKDVHPCKRGGDRDQTAT